MKRLLPLILLAAGLCTPPVSRSQTVPPQVGIRLLAVRTEAEASSLRAQMQNGSSFEELARQHSIDPSASSGGYIGIFRLTDLKPEFQRALEGLVPGRVSPVTRVDGEFMLLQLLSPEEVNWTAANDDGIKAYEAGNYAEAAESFHKALEYAEKLTPVDYRLEDSLHGLAESYRLQRKFAEAEPVYRRYLSVHWGGPTAPDLLDRCAALIAVSYFKDAQFEEASRAFGEAVSRAPMNEDLYQAISALLYKAQLIPESETLMLRAAQLFPQSRDVHFHLAQVYLGSGRSQRALEVFEELSRMKAPVGLDPSIDRLQQSVVYQKIGGIRAELGDFDQATAAYRKALELTPGSAESRLGLGDVYLRQGRTQDALAEYAPVAAADPRNSLAQFRVADASLRSGQFPEAAEVAARVLAMDPRHGRAHYVLATALLRMDRREEGDKELETFRKLEAEARAETDRSRNIVVLNRGAAGKFLEGHAEEAIELFRNAIESYPESPAPYLNLGIVQSKLGRHQSAVETFQKMLSLGMDENFLVYRNLSQEYGILGDVDASLRHQVVYLQNMDVALREALDWNLE